MNIQELPLILFTILAQMSIGSFAILGFLYFLSAKKTDVKVLDRQTDLALLAIFPVLGLALLASLFHLGNPFNAYYAVTNLGTSWLSREILSGVAFALVGGLFALLQWRKVGSFQVRNVLAWIAAIIGVGMVYIMFNVYALPAQPAWNTVFNLVGFYATTFSLGSIAVGAALVAAYIYLQKKNAEETKQLEGVLRQSLKWIAGISIAMLGVQFLVIPLNLAILSSEGGAASVSAGMYYGQYAGLFSLRLVLAFLGAGVLASFIYRAAESSTGEKVLPSLVYLALVVVLASELIGRFLFYVAKVRVGL